MNVKPIRAYLALCSLAVALHPQSLAQQNSDQSKTSAAERDGQHDFDPLIGKWKYHLKPSGGSIGLTARSASWTHPRLANSKTDAARFSPRIRSTAKPF